MTEVKSTIALSRQLATSQYADGLVRTDHLNNDSMHYLLTRILTSLCVALVMMCAHRVSHAATIVSGYQFGDARGQGAISSTPAAACLSWASVYPGGSSGSYWEPNGSICSIYAAGKLIWSGSPNTPSICSDGTPVVNGSCSAPVQSCPAGQHIGYGIERVLSPVYASAGAACSSAMEVVGAGDLAVSGNICKISYPNGGSWAAYITTGCVAGCADGATPDLSRPLATQCTAPANSDPSCKAEQSNPNSCVYSPTRAVADNNLGAPASCQQRTGNPINNATGNKLQIEPDYHGTGSVGLELQRNYNGLGIRNGRYGARWSSNYEKMMLLNSSYPNNVGVQRNDGKLLNFTWVSGTTYKANADITDSLSIQTNAQGEMIAWLFTVGADQSIERYDTNGKLLSITSREGWVQTLSYSDLNTPVAVAPQPGLLLNVTDQFGHQLNFTYDSSGRVIQMTDPAGKTIGYSYDSNNNLASVTYQDGKTRTYVYNEAAYTAGANLPTALTGIIDENNVRFATFNYDSSGRGISTEHVGGVEKYSIGYTQAGSQSTVTDPLGTVRTYTYQMLLNTIKSTGQNQPGGAGCGAASSAVTYDANGNVATRTDFNGSVTTYSYDLTRNLETSRVEASGTSQARTITTAWHTTYSLPLQIAEPKLLTTYVYDTAGNLLSKTVRATSDATGAQGLSPVLVGTARTWSYTYNTVGQVLTATGPRTDVVDKTTYTYDSSGNLSTITNAVGQVTTLSNYDANGRVGLITDANGATTALTYSPRGWLTSKTVTSGGTVETTTYGYDGVGQLTLVTLPNASTVSYTYDPAHRLTNIADSLGNSIAYTLDNMGNRISEQVKDPSGALARQTSRVIDTLNRIQKITGGIR
jgi:YD repeat-containing protein